MLTWNQLHIDLETVSNRHRRLAAVFSEFAKSVAEQVTDKHFHISGISATLNIDQGFFTISFAGRTLYFAFASVIEENGTMVGNVHCYIKREFPAVEHIAVGNFRFTGKGQTNLIEPEEQGPVTIDGDLADVYVALHFIHESLSL